MSNSKPTPEQKQMFERTAAKKPSTSNTLGTILEEAGLVSRDMIRGLVPEDESAASLKHAMVSHGLVQEEDIIDALSAHMGFEKVSLRDLKPTEDLINQLEARHAIKYRVFPVRYDANTLWVATADPLEIHVQDDLSRVLHKSIELVVASETEINKFIKHFYEGTDIADLYSKMTDEAAVEEQEKKEDEFTRLDMKAGDEADEPPVVRYVDLLFKQSVHDRASDIHVEPTKMGISIRFRIDGVLHEVPAPPKRWQNAMISRLKVLSGMDLAEKRIPLDGRIKLNIPGKKLDVRVSSIPTIFGESIVMRLLDQDSVLMGLEDVGFLPDTVRIFKDLIRAPNGVILMTGPTGSGKTTTLYSALSTINNSETKIITVEDPVEYMLDGVNQVQVNKEIGLDFGIALRSMLRQSPDVIMVGEMRDLETAEIGIRAALTGHLVFSTLHTNDAPSACVRLIDMGIKPFLVASSVQAVIAQRLARKICNYCKVSYTPAPDEWAITTKPLSELGDRKFCKGEGCDRCSKSGYRGRTAIHEVFLMNAELRSMVIRVESGQKLKKTGIKCGMRTLRMDGVEKIILGHTTPQEIMRITAEDAH